MIECKQCESVHIALNTINAAQAADSTQRILDTAKHHALVFDAVTFESDKLEQSLRTQITYWSQMAISIVILND